MRNGRNLDVHRANALGDAMHNMLHPGTAADDALAIYASSTLKDRLGLPRRQVSAHDRYTTAVHESGHVLVGFKSDAKHIEVRIREDGTGITIARTIEDAEAGILYSLAGPFAEIKFNPPRIHSYTDGSPCFDLLAARTKIDALNASRAWPQLTYRAAAKSAMKFIQNFWPSIQDLALALDDAGELDDQAIRIFARCRS
jgi:hypothetical protein